MNPPDLAAAREFALTVLSLLRTRFAPDAHATLMILADIASLTLLFGFFYRALNQSIPRIWRLSLLLLGVSQAGFVWAIGTGSGLLLLLVFAFGWGLHQIRRGDQAGGHMAIASASAVLALISPFSFALALLSFPAALILSKDQTRTTLLGQSLLAGFPPLCLLAAFAFTNWMAIGDAFAAPQPIWLLDANDAVSGWSLLMAGRLVEPFFVLIVIVFLFAPHALMPKAPAARSLAILVALAGAIATFSESMAAAGLVAAVGSVIALVAALALPPAQAGVGLAVASLMGWALLSPIPPLSTQRAAPPLADRDSGAWGVRESFMRTNPRHVPRLHQDGGRYTYESRD